ncbi:MAG TPA: HNH endonuclease [Chitinophagaceae bacterium]|jgi:5-methylcytosine-specific restriction protein A|nr:HNH endonuclease [Chitinophagaceae bacterium]
MEIKSSKNLNRNLGMLLNDVLNLGAIQALYRDNGIWYHPLRNFPGVLFDKNGYVLFLNETSYRTHEKLKQTKALHVKDGISSLPEYKAFSEEDKKIIAISITRRGIIHSKQIDEEMVRIIRQYEIIKRDQKLVSEIKKKYKNFCQICGHRIQVGKNLFYSEVHHIKPLGSPHNGPDCLENMICVCPNDHILLDFFIVALNLSTLKLIRHNINEEYISYYNEIRKRFD